MTTPILPRLPDVVEYAKFRLGAVRPSAQRFIDAGRWGDPIAQWKAECSLVLHRLATEVCSARLGLAEGQALFDLVTSEFGAAIAAGPSHAMGNVVLTRPPPLQGGRLPGGLIRAGTRFRKTADPRTCPPVAAAEYESTTPVFVPPHTGQVPQSVVVSMAAVNAGSDGNTQPWETAVFALSETLFDKNLSVQEGQAAGGAGEFSAVRLRSLAVALATGQYGPVSNALVAGALSTPGVARCVTRSGAGETIWIADESWCWSKELLAAANQTIQNGWLGFGCRYELKHIHNLRASVAADVTLRNAGHVADSVDIAEAIKRDVKAYFDDRPDFYMWKRSALRSVITQADRRILSCQWADVRDVDGNTLDEPGGSAEVVHYDVDTTNATLEFFVP